MPIVEEVKRHMISFMGTKVIIVETGETITVRDPKVREFISKIVQHEEKERKIPTYRKYNEGVRAGIDQCKERITNALRGI